MMENDEKYMILTHNQGVPGSSPGGTTSIYKGFSRSLKPFVIYLAYNFAYKRLFSNAKNPLRGLIWGESGSVLWYSSGYLNLRISPFSFLHISKSLNPPSCRFSSLAFNSAFVLDRQNT